MIIDFHTHIWPRAGNAARLVACMDSREIELSVVLAIEPSLDPEILSPNHYVVEECRKYPDRLIPFCSVDPCESRAHEILEQWVLEGCRGLKLHPPLQGIDLAGQPVKDLLHKAADLNVPVLIHTGPVFTPLAPLIPNDLYLIDRLAAAIPNANLILAHADPLGVAPVIAGRHQNVFLDTAVIWPRVTTIVPRSGEGALEFIGTGGQAGWTRLLFGSDANPDRYARADTAMDSIRALDLPEEHRRAILGNNAFQLLQLGEQRALA
jgi:predicted TIM-barrel fold metal-dependent hydrolase